MFILGITGGIGAGKSKVLNYLNTRFNAYIVEADSLAKELMLPGGQIYDKIYEHFPTAIPIKGRPIDRKVLADIVYNDEKALHTLNSLVHPAVKEFILNDIKAKELQGTGLYVIEAALLIEDGYKEICNELWYVRADIDVRINRLVTMRDMSREDALKVIRNQKPDEFYMDNSDFILDNNSDFDAAKRAIDFRIYHT